MKKKVNAFSIVEVLVVIAVFMIITGIVVVKFEDSQKTGRDSVRVKDLGEVANALENYYTKNGSYPDGLSNLVPAFLPEVPADPKNQSPYLYSYCPDSSSPHQKYAIMAKLEANNQALQGDYDKDWPDIGTACDCNGNETTGDTTVELEQTSSPFTYCIKNP